MRGPPTRAASTASPEPVAPSDLVRWPTEIPPRELLYTSGPEVLHGLYIEVSARENTPDAPAEAVEEAARLAEAHEFISALSEGCDIRRNR